MSTLEIHNVSKSYGNIKALSRVRLSFSSGRRYGIAGQNGAGKSTLVKILSGIDSPDRGRVLFRNREISPLTPRKALLNGIATIHQNIPLISTLSLHQNLTLGRESYLSSLREPFLTVFEKFRQLIDSSKAMVELGSDEVFFINLCRSLLWEPAVLIIDEATSRLSTDSKDLFYKCLSPLINSGLILLIVSHDLEEIQRNCDEVIGLRDGEVVFQDMRDRLDLETFRSSIFGRDTQPEEPILADVQLPSPRLKFSVNDLQVDHNSPKISFNARGGDLICIYADEQDFLRDIFEAIVGWRGVFNGQLSVGRRTLNQWDRNLLRSLDVVWLPPDPQNSSFPLISTVQSF